MIADLKMCKGASSLQLQTDELLDMISCTVRKKMRVRGDLRLEVLLNSTYKSLDRKLKEKQQSRKRKWQELKTDLFKRPRCEDTDSICVAMDSSCEDSSYEELLGLGDFFNSLKAVSSSPDKVL